MAIGQTSTDSTVAGPAECEPGLQTPSHSIAGLAPSLSGGRGHTVGSRQPPSGGHRDSALAVSVAGPHPGVIGVMERQLSGHTGYSAAGNPHRVGALTPSAERSRACLRDYGYWGVGPARPGALSP